MDNKQKEALRQTKELIIQDDNDVKSIINSPQGIRFIRRLLAQCGLGTSSHIAGDSHSTAFNEGRRNIGLWLQSQISKHPENYFKIIGNDKND